MADRIDHGENRSPAVNRQWQVSQLPQDGVPLEAAFALVETEKPSPGDGQFLVENRCFSIEPAMLPWMMSLTDYMVPQGMGEPMLSWATGEVIVSNHPGFSVGDRVSGTFGWQSYYVSNGLDINCDVVQKVPEGVSDEVAMNALWISGLTAFIGLYEVGRPVIGDTVLVSGAAGSVGNLVGQFAKLAGCRVVGIAGSDQKCAWLRDELGFDAAINYKTEELIPAIQAACPGGVDIYWDNVGGDMLNNAVGCLAVGGRVVLCGAISLYTDFNHIPPITNWPIVAGNRATMSGFNVTCHKDKFAHALGRISLLLKQDKLILAHDVLNGFEQLPVALGRIYAGLNIGKQLVKVK
ncbi:MAG: NADP-dependent oxidoreductase [Halioglobus sp.]